MAQTIRIYALSTCHHCSSAKELLDERKIPYDCVYVDRLYAEERNETMALLRTLNPVMSFPTIVIGDKVVVGFSRDVLEEALKDYPH